jgi:hypothetical protein
MIIFPIKLYCPIDLHRPHRSIRIDKCHNKIIIAIIIIITTIIIIPKPNNFTKIQAQYNFPFCSCNLLAETNNFVFCVVLLLLSVSELRNPSLPVLETRSFRRLWPFSLQFPCQNKQKQSWHRVSIVLSFRARETTVIGTQTQDLVLELWPFYILFLVSRNKRTNFGANRFIRSWARSKDI